MKAEESRTPRMIKRTLKPDTKQRVCRKHRFLFGSCCLSSAVFPAAGLRPPPKKISHDGMRGTTQGEKNDSNPAAKAIKTERPVRIT
jgi:hypothetical protein